MTVLELLKIQHVLTLIPENTEGLTFGSSLEISRIISAIDKERGEFIEAFKKTYAEKVGKAWEELDEEEKKEADRVLEEEAGKAEATYTPTLKKSGLMEMRAKEGKNINLVGIATALEPILID